MIDKRGQVTVFIILGIIVLSTVMAVIFYKSGVFTTSINAGKLQPIGTIDHAVTLYVEACLQNLLAEAVFSNGQYGGYFVLPELSTTEFNENVPFYQKKGLDVSPSDSLLSEEVSRYVDVMLPGCLNDFAPFKEQGYKFKIDEINSKASLSSTYLKIATILPLTITGNNFVKELTDFSAEISSVPFYSSFIAARELLKTQDQNQLCVTCLADLAADNNLFIAVLSLNNRSQLIDINARDYVLNGDVYHLQFAVEFDETNS